MNLAIMGDSSADEYRGTDNRGGAYAPTTFNWVELLARHQKINVGAWGNYSEPRRTGYAWNFARSGATAQTLVSGGQHFGVAAEIANGNCDTVLIWVGTNDYAAILYYLYTGILAGVTLTQWENAFIDSIKTAVGILPPAKVYINKVVDFMVLPGVPGMFPDVAGRTRISNSIARINSRLAQIPNITLIDSLELTLSLVTPSGIFYVGGVPICQFCVGDEPHNGILSGAGSHPGTVFSGKLANWILSKISPSTIPLTDNQILKAAGLA
jgi:hypothetical protein